MEDAAVFGKKRARVLPGILLIPTEEKEGGSKDARRIPKKKGLVEANVVPRRKRARVV